MATTNHTPTIELSQYISTDKTSYLVNYNDDMLKIDGAIAADRDDINTAQNTADTAEDKADTNKLSIDAINAELNDASTGVLKRLTDVEGDVNTIESLIGNGVPTTQDKTIIGAINELAGEIPSGDVAAEDVTYDNTDSGLTATNAQDAIDELKDEIDNISSYRVIATGTGTTLGDKLESVKTAYDSLSEADKINSALIINDNLILRAAGKSSFTFSVIYGSATTINVEIARIISDDYKILANTIDGNGFSSSDITANTSQTLALIVV